MHGSVGPLEVNAENRTYAAVIGSRNGGVICRVLLKQTFPGGYDATRSAWSSATLLKQDVVEDQLLARIYTQKLENKIAGTFEVNQACNRYASRLGSRTGACISSATLRYTVFEDAVK